MNYTPIRRFIFIWTITIVSTFNLCAQTSINIPGSKVNFDLILIAGGNHNIGSTEVQLDSFWIGKHEVTFDEYILFQDLQWDTDAASEHIKYKADAVTRPSPPYEDFTKGMGREGGFPVVSVTQQAALSYCHWLYQKTGIFYRLPTEAEWEYACLSGETDRSDEDELEEVAWFYENSFEKFQKTGEKEANELGIHDMLGNIAEWTADYYLDDDKYQSFLKDSTAINPWVVPPYRHSRTVKGGSYDDSPEDCTCQSRLKSRARWQARDPQIPRSKWWNTDAPFVGFRIVRPVHQPDAKAIAEYFDLAIKY